MISWVPRSRRSRLLAALLVPVLGLAAAGCAKPDRAPLDDPRKTQPATLLPADIALAYLQEIKSATGKSLLAGETNVPPCLLTDKGTWSGGEYRKLTTQRAPRQVTEYGRWILFKVTDPAGQDLSPVQLDRPNSWTYSIRTPRSARTVFGTVDHCIIGPTGEPPRKIVEALAALGVELAPDYAYIFSRK